MSNSLGHSPVRLLIGCFTLLCFAAFSGRGQTVVSMQDARHLTSLGIDESGALVILGDIENYEPALFELSGTGFKVTRLPALSGGEFPEAYRISRDARYVVGSCQTPEFQDAAMLWLRSDVAVPMHLGTLDGSSSTYPQDVASTPSGPLIIGNSIRGAFIWTQADGMRPWIPSDAHQLHPYLERVSEDGKLFVGEGFINGQILPILGTESNLMVLDFRKGFGGALSISPNGFHICGFINLQSTV